MDFQILTSTLFFVSLAILWLGYFTLYKEYVVDTFRQNVFDLRDELFFDAHGGLISFDHPAYCILRRLMNGLIRFGHDLSFLKAVITHQFLRKNEIVKKENDNFANEFSVAVEELSDEQKKVLKKYRKKLNIILAKHFVMEAPILVSLLFILFLVLVIPMAICVKCFKCSLETAREAIRERINGIESEALAFGKL